MSLKFENVVPEDWTFIFLCYIYVIILRAGTSTNDIVIFKASFCRFFGGTLLRPIVGAVVSIQKSATLQNVPGLCASVQGESWAVSSSSSTATSATKIT